MRRRSPVSTQQSNREILTHFNIDIAGLKVFVRQILLYLYGMYPVRGIG